MGFRPGTHHRRCWSLGLAAAACLKVRGVPSTVLERSNCIASLWQLKTYDRLRLHLPKQFCELPLMPFPESFPTYPTKQQFVEYLEAYAEKFDIRPVFGEAVERAEFDESLGFWRVRSSEGRGYVCRWLVVATGENAEAVVPEIEGRREFLGPILHTSLYKSGEVFRGKRVLVVGCGNSGMEVCLDLCNHNATPSLVVRETVHILPREMLGKSTFGLSMWLLKWLPLGLVDRLLLIVSRLLLGNTARLGLDRPQVCPGIRRLTHDTAEFVNGRKESFDAIILATGYKSNVPSWLKTMFSEEDGLPRRPFPNGWKGESGLYAVGFTKRGLLGASIDAKRIAEDIEQCWKAKAKHLTSFAKLVNLKKSIVDFGGFFGGTNGIMCWYQGVAPPFEEKKKSRKRFVGVKSPLFSLTPSLGK
ncbi:hypothetical protein HYC85_023143 [Camellia sinensis]|uniref:indole-3-pyruvate monooxygenase n=1 Tax=Camellia sinensis TaxID=4442 RepID=A0A7J7GHI3_CAMSI|nr:hypothetical protein HYC85_023143 [Camellia sinensis]